MFSVSVNDLHNAVRKLASRRNGRQGGYAANSATPLTWQTLSWYQSATSSSVASARFAMTVDTGIRVPRTTGAPKRTAGSIATQGEMSHAVATSFTKRISWAKVLMALVKVGFPRYRPTISWVWPFTLAQTLTPSVKKDRRARGYAMPGSALRSASKTFLTFWSEVPWSLKRHTVSRLTRSRKLITLDSGSRFVGGVTTASQRRNCRRVASCRRSMISAACGKE